MATRPWVALPGPAFWGDTALQAWVSCLSVAMLLRADQVAPASRVAVWEYALVPFAALWALVLWGQGIAAPEAVGMALIVAAGLLLLRVPAARGAAA